MVAKGFPVEDDVTKPNHTLVFSFPIKSPEGAVYRDDMTAIQQLELWKTYQTYWCEHKPSITVYVRENEWLDVGAWVYANFDMMSGVSFLPHTDHVYRQAPYQEITKEQYEEFVKLIPEVDWVFDEQTDTTTASQEYACVGGACDIV
jgi:ribonucleoside-diphosphate reductase alpha chain